MLPILPTENFFKKVFTSKLLSTHYLLQEATAKFIMSKKCFFTVSTWIFSNKKVFFWKSKKCSDYLTPTSGSKGVTEAVKKKHELPFRLHLIYEGFVSLQSFRRWCEVTRETYFPKKKLNCSKYQVEKLQTM